MLVLNIISSLLTLLCLFTNHRLFSLISFLSFSLVNLLALYVDSSLNEFTLLFTSQVLGALIVYVGLSARSKDESMTHQKKRASPHLITWSLVVALWFGFILKIIASELPLLAKQVHDLWPLLLGMTVVALWNAGRTIYDNR